jgi:hypothetical protein
VTLPKTKPCPRCENPDTDLYGYGDCGPLVWHVECDRCYYLGPGGTQLQAVRAHNAAYSALKEEYRTKAIPTPAEARIAADDAPGPVAVQDGREGETC